MLYYPITINKGEEKMLINKYIQEATETELLSYKLVLSSQIIEAQKSLELIEIARRKIELREPNDITGDVWKTTKEDPDTFLEELGNPEHELI